MGAPRAGRQEALALSQFLPGPNIVNLAIVVGQRYRGALGAAAAALGLLVAPVAIMMVCGALYERYGGLPSLRNALAGLTAAAAGLLLAMVARLLQPLLLARRVPGLLFAITAFVAVGLLRLPLYWVLLVLGPLSVAVAWWRLK
ncbi:MAG TPA: chromate transporter [Xanthobacteraceae bacterium]|nr:chromate transporter [Xanthobacteraceae bacterium]